MVENFDGHNNVIIENDNVKIFKDKTMITFNGRGIVTINGKNLYGSAIVNRNDIILYSPLKIDGKRECIIVLNNDKTEAKLSTNYTEDEITYITAIEQDGNIILEEATKSNGWPKIFNEAELYEQINSKKIIFGINKARISYLSNQREIFDECIAKGMMPIDGVDDKVELIERVNKLNSDEENLGRVDYKEIFSINYVNDGELIGEIKRGIVGVDGKDVLGNAIPRRKKKRLEIKAASGCRCENDKFYATINGQPLYKGGYFTVNQLLTIETDVDIKSGNIKFSGDLAIFGDVKEGMEVVTLGSIKIAKGVYRANVTSNNAIDIKGNVIASNINAGVANVILQNKMQCLNQIYNDLSNLYKNVSYLKENKLITQTTPDSQIIRGLLETKYRNVIKDCNRLFELFKDDNNEIIDNIKEILIGYNILNIKSSFEILKLAQQINSLCEQNTEYLNETHDLNISTAYESKCEASGNIYIGEKGIVACEMYAGKDIIFANDTSTCRGGHLKAGNNILAGIVGSETGGRTILEVLEKGKIVINKCFKNTILIVGTKRYVCEKDERLVEAYLDKKGDLIVNKLSL